MFRCSWAFTRLSRQPNLGNRRWKHYILSYKYVPDILEKREPHRPGHLNLLRELKKQGKVLLGGALMDPIDSALVVFECDDMKPIEEFIQKDPYVLNGLVVEHIIREWAVVPLE